MTTDMILRKIMTYFLILILCFHFLTNNLRDTTTCIIQAFKV